MVIDGYWCLLMANILLVIGDCFISGYQWILVAINWYYINGYWWLLMLLYQWLLVATILMAIGGYSVVSH